MDRMKLYHYLYKVTKRIGQISFYPKCKGKYETALENLYAIYTPNKEVIDIKTITMDTELSCDLSIIIPVYNSHKYLEKCLDSLVNQKTQFTYELLLINDGSTDDSLEILQKYQQKYPKCIKVFSQTNQGISATRNKGIEEATGRYIGFVDNDDFVDEEYIQVLLERAKESNADIVKCGHYRWNSEKEVIIANICYKEVAIRGDLERNIIEYKGFIWEGIMKRELWDDIRFPIGFWYEDIITRLILFRKSKHFEYIEKSLYYYNLHENNASKKVWNNKSYKALDQLYLTKELVDYCKKIGIEQDVALSYCLIHELGEVLWLRTRKLSNKYRKQVFLVARNIILENVAIEKCFDECERNIYQSYLENDYIRWNICSFSKMLGIKFKNGDVANG